eukprot:32961-Prorocentrum_lima.AAC.1
MAEALDAVLLADLKARVAAARYVAVTVDESKANDNVEFMSVEVAFVEDGIKQQEFVTLKKVTAVDALSLHNELCIVMRGMLGITDDQLVVKLVGFGSDGAS